MEGRQDESSSSSHSRRRSERLGKKSSRYFDFEEQDEEKGEKKKSLKRKSGEKSEKAKVRQIMSDDSTERRSSSEESDSSRVMVPTNPKDWESKDVQAWLNWMSSKFSLENLNPEKFPSSGLDLCKLGREDFSKLTGNPKSGQILATHLAYLRGEPEPDISRTTATIVTEPTDTTTTTIDQPSSSQPLKQSALLSEEQEINETNYVQFLPAASGSTSQIQLWQFLLELLSEPDKYSDIIIWEKGCGEFRLIDPDEVAQKWGIRKSKVNMNYDKLSRALRYYYDKNILAKIPGKRYAYKFDFHALTLACRAQQCPTPSDAKLSELSGILAPLLNTVQRATSATPTSTYRGRQSPETGSTRSATPRPESHSSLLDTSFSPSSCSVQSPVPDPSSIEISSIFCPPPQPSHQTQSSFSEFDMWAPHSDQQQQEQHQYELSLPQEEYQPHHQLPPYTSTDTSSLWSQIQAEEMYMSTPQQQQLQQGQTSSNQFDIYPLDRWSSWDTSSQSDYLLSGAGLMMSPPLQPAQQQQQQQTLNGRSHSQQTLYDTNGNNDPTKHGPDMSHSIEHSRSNSVPSDMYFLAQTADTHGSFSYAQ